MNTEATDPDAVPVHPAATVIPLRDSPDGVEVLVLRRDTGLVFHGGSWVFPGGRVDAHEIASVFGDDVAGNDLAAARLAAAREADEEAGLKIDPADLVPLSHWTTPPGRNRRYATWFFVVAAPDGEVVIDDGEIREFEWLTITEAVKGCDAGEIALAAPGYVSLLRLAPFPTVADALAGVDPQTVEVFRPLLVKEGGRYVSIYEGDPAYTTGDLTLPGPRHRNYMLEVGYRYVNELNELPAPDAASELAEPNY